MPELPEVETIKLGLKKYLVGHKILDVEVLDKKLFEGEIKDIVGEKIEKVRRFGKGLVIDLNNKYSVAVHIKLTGQLIYRDRKSSNSPPTKPYVGIVPNKFTRVIFILDKESFLYFNDIRRFAWMKIIKTDDVGKLPFFKDLGPEPPVARTMGGQVLLTLEKFQAILSKSSAVIKSLIMDQKKMGGVGNIYANDALFLAGVDPRKKSKELSEEKAKKLYKAILEVLKNGLKYGGASEMTFVNASGEKGSYQKHFLVYSREGQKCRRCGGIIRKIFLSGRGTYFCPKCQR